MYSVTPISISNADNYSGVLKKSINRESQENTLSRSDGFDTVSFKSTKLTQEVVKKANKNGLVPLLLSLPVIGRLFASKNESAKDNSIEEQKPVVENDKSIETSKPTDVEKAVVDVDKPVKTDKPTGVWIINDGNIDKRIDDLDKGFIVKPKDSRAIKYVKFDSDGNIMAFKTCFDNGYSEVNRYNPQTGELKRYEVLSPDNNILVAQEFSNDKIVLEEFIDDLGRQVINEYSSEGRDQKDPFKNLRKNLVKRTINIISEEHYNDGGLKSSTIYFNSDGKPDKVVEKYDDGKEKTFIYSYNEDGSVVTCKNLENGVEEKIYYDDITGELQKIESKDFSIEFSRRDVGSRMPLHIRSNCNSGAIEKFDHAGRKEVSYLIDRLKYLYFNEKTSHLFTEDYVGSKWAFLTQRQYHLYSERQDYSRLENKTFNPYFFS